MQEKRFKINFLFPLVTGILSVIWIVKGIFEYGLWDSSSQSPGDGLFPMIIAIVLLICSVINLINSFKAEPISLDKRAVLLAACLAAIYFLVKYTGFLPTLFVFYILWLKLYAKCSWKTVMIAFVIMFAIVYGAFGLWLKVRFPAGILFEKIF